MMRRIMSNIVHVSTSSTQYQSDSKNQGLTGVTPPPSPHHAKHTLSCESSSVLFLCRSSRWSPALQSESPSLSLLLAGVLAADDFCNSDTRDVLPPPPRLSSNRELARLESSLLPRLSTSAK